MEMMSKKKNSSDDQKSKGYWIAFSAVIIGAIVTGLFGIYIAGIKTARDPDGTNSNQANTRSLPRKFNYAVIVRDRDTNNLIGHATVLLAVGNETIDEIVTDDNGQANFSIDASYDGKNARIYVKAPDYHPTDLEISLSTESRKIIQLISNK